MENLNENLVAVKTLFGWTIQGHNGYKEQADVLSFLNVAECEKKELDVTDFWNLESIGIKLEESRDDDMYEKTTKSIVFVNDRYRVSLPWKNTKETLNDNKNVATKRLNNLTYKLMKNTKQLLEYDNEIRQLVNKKIAEKVLNSSSGYPIYYMPHKPVYREEKTTSKLRIVFDASSSELGYTSLNDHLSPVDNTVADLLVVLLKFRSNRVALIADIEKAFLQISIDENDRDSHRFLWYETTPQENKKLPKLCEFRMTRVTFGITCSPFLLSATIQHHIEKYEEKYKSICSKLKKSFYVDDLILSVKSEDEAKQIYNVGKEIMKKAQFNLRKWRTNSKDVMNIIKSDVSNEQKVLGINWCTTTDTLSVSIMENINYLQELKPTKRSVMKAMAKLYDPMGFLGPFTVRIKLILQDIWKENIEWDDMLVGETCNAFQKWQNELEFLSEFRLQRCLSWNADSRKELHIFADASPKAFGAVAYIRSIQESDEITTSFICSKNRVSPMK